jgi:hypothetical protein
MDRDINQAVPRNELRELALAGALLMLLIISVL